MNEGTDERKTNEMRKFTLRKQNGNEICNERAKRAEFENDEQFLIFFFHSFGKINKRYLAFHK